MATSHDPEAVIFPQVFWARVRSPLTVLAANGHPQIAHYILDALNHLVPIDPAGVLLLAQNVVTTSSAQGYQYESLAQNLIVGMVERYLAEYRHLFRTNPECGAALMKILDIFVQVGWPQALDLTYRFDDIYR